MKRILVFLICFWFIPFVNATFALTHAYSEDRPIVLQPGESFSAEVYVLNVIPDSGDIAVRASLGEGADIASLNGEDIINIPFGERATIPIEINIPADAAIDERYSVGLSVSQIGGDGGDSVTFSVSVDTSFPVVVGEVSSAPEIEDTSFTRLEEKPRFAVVDGNSVWLIIVGVLAGSVLGIVIGITQIIRRARKKNTSFVRPEIRFAEGSF